MMKISEFKKLENKLKSHNFHQEYKNINLVMKILSYFGHIASIFLAYFLISKILSSAITNNFVIVLLSSLIILSGVELLKRDIFDKFSIEYLKNKNLNKKVLPLFVLSLILISISFYSSLNGAREFSNKNDEIENFKKETITHFKDSVNNIYQLKIKEIEDEIKIIKNKIDLKDKEQTEIEAQKPLTRQQISRINDLKSEKIILREDIKKLENDILKLKDEMHNLIKTKENEISSETQEKKRNNNKDSILFVILSSIIEIVILAGVFFGKYYDYRSYREFKNAIENDSNYQKWNIYDKILNIIYTDDIKINDKLPSNKDIIEMCRINDIILLKKDVEDFIKLLTSLNIIKTSGKYRYFIKHKDTSIELLKKHFKIE